MANARSTISMARSTPAQKPRGLASSSSMFLALEAVPDQQCRAAGDGRVSEVECGEMVAAPIEIEEVHHVTVSDAVDQVAQRAAKNECQCKAEQSLRLMLAQQPDDPYRGDDGDGTEQPALCPACIVKETECRARVVRQHQVEERRHRQTLVINEMAADRRLAQLVEHDDDRSDCQPTIRHNDAPLPCRTGCSRSVRTAPGERRRCPHLRGNASSGRIWHVRSA